MVIEILALAFQLVAQSSNRALQPAWSPDHQVLATAEVSQRFVTPEGAGCHLLLNQHRVYPPKKRKWFAGYDGVHTFLSELSWSPDSQRVAFVEKIYDWEYTDPFNYDFAGTLKKQKFYLVLVSKDGRTAGYALPPNPDSATLHWLTADQLALGKHTYDLETNPPKPIP